MNEFLNILTVDVEDYYMVSAFSDVIRPEEWDFRESRLESNTMRVLDLLGSAGAKGTFFVLGWVAERFPGIVQEIDRRGHEVACHSYRHRLVYRMTFGEFREDARISKAILEQTIGKAVHGYRAPSFSITKESFWALEILKEVGFSYDSSIFPIHHDRYGYPEFPRFPSKIETGSGPIIEVPLSTVQILGKNIPVGGGGYLRLFPYPFTEWAIRRLNDKERRAAILYFHPWEVDPEPPRMNGTFLSRVRHYGNIGQTESRVGRLMRNFRFGPVYESMGSAAWEAGEAEQ